MGISLRLVRLPLSHPVQQTDCRYVLGDKGHTWATPSTLSGSQFGAAN